MSNLPAKTEIPIEIFDFAEEPGCTPASLKATVETFFPDIILNRSDCRDIIAKVHEENRLDKVAANPSDTSALEKMANQGLYNELVLILEDQRMLIEARTDMKVGELLVLPGMDESDALDRDGIDMKLRAIGSRIQSLRKSITDASPQDGKGGPVSVNLNMMLNDAIGRINDVEASVVE